MFEPKATASHLDSTVYIAPQGRDFSDPCRFGHGLSTRQDRNLLRDLKPLRPLRENVLGPSRIGEVSHCDHLSQEALHRPTCQRLLGEAEMKVTRVASMAVAAVVVACVADETTRSQAAAIGSGLKVDLQLPLG